MSGYKPINQRKWKWMPKWSYNEKRRSLELQVKDSIQWHQDIGFIKTATRGSVVWLNTVQKAYGTFSTQQKRRLKQAGIKLR
jgi:hypothetical protein